MLYKLCKCKLLVMFCLIYSWKKWFYFMIYKVYCKQVNKLFFWRVERINLFYIINNGKISFGFRTTRFSNSFPERIVFVNRGLTVAGYLQKQTGQICDNDTMNYYDKFGKYLDQLNRGALVLP